MTGWIGALLPLYTILLLYNATASCLFSAGDNSKVAAQVAAVVGIPHFLAELKPEDKLAYVQGFKSDNTSQGWATGGLALTGFGGGHQANV